MSATLSHFSASLRPARQRWAHRWEIISLGQTAGRGIFAAAIGTSVVVGLIPIAFVIWSGVLVGRVGPAVSDGWDSHAGYELRVAIAATVALLLLDEVLTPFQTIFGDAIGRRVDAGVRERLAAAATAADVVVLEDQEMLDRLVQVRRPYEWTWSTPGHAVAGMLVTFGRYVPAVAGVVVVAVLWSALAAAALLATTLFMRYGQHRSMRKEMVVRKDTGALLRRGQYFSSLGTDRSAGKELRLFGLTEWVIDRFKAAQMAMFEVNWGARRKALGAGYALVASVSTAVCLLIALVLAWSAVTGGMPLASFLIVFMASGIILRPSTQGREDDATRWGFGAYHALTEFEKSVEELSPTLRTIATRLPGGTFPETDISFKQVSFSYADGGRRVLNSLDLVIPAGRSLAVVGLNGAGKTTLVKLLAGLYDPTDGQITVDDLDLAHVDLDDWRRHMAVIFQDFIHYELTVADNIALGAIEFGHDRAALERAARRADILDVIESLPRGFETILSRQYEGGAELSGGQWQRLAIARALFAVEAGASVLVLDEPTANLDVRSEVEFYNQFLSLTKGLTSIVISHRFSTVRLADTIVVIEAGGIVESGSHDDLLRLGGRYANLFQLQAARFEDASE